MPTYYPTPKQDELLFSVVAYYGDLLEFGLPIYTNVDKNLLKILIDQVRYEYPKNIEDQSINLIQLVDNLSGSRSERD